MVRAVADPVDADAEAVDRAVVVRVVQEAEVVEVAEEAGVAEAVLGAAGRMRSRSVIVVRSSVISITEI